MPHSLRSLGLQSPLAPHRRGQGLAAKERTPRPPPHRSLPDPLDLGFPLIGTAHAHRLRDLWPLGRFAPRRSAAVRRGRRALPRQCSRSAALALLRREQQHASLPCSVSGPRPQAPRSPRWSSPLRPPHAETQASPARCLRFAGLCHRRRHGTAPLVPRSVAHEHRRPLPCQRPRPPQAAPTSARLRHASFLPALCASIRGHTRKPLS